MEMIRIANVYLSEGNLEYAYILNMRYMILFLEKIPKHPEYKSVPANILKSNKDKLEDVMTTTEKLKSKLLDRFGKEYGKYLEERKKELENEKAIKKVKEAAAAEEAQKNLKHQVNTIIILILVSDMNFFFF